MLWWIFNSKLATFLGTRNYKVIHIYSRRSGGGDDGAGGGDVL